MERHIVKTITDYGTHSYKVLYEYEESIHCPNCGINNVWIEMSSGDYYEGNTHLCVNCTTTFTLPSIGSYGDEHNQSVEDIREYIKQNKIK